MKKLVIPDAIKPGPAARQLGRMLALYGMVGIVAGLAAVFFVFLVDAVGDEVLVPLTGIDPTEHGHAATPMGLSWPSGGRWWLLIVPAAGGLISGILCATFAPEAMGTGTGATIDAYHRRRGFIRRRVPWVKTVASALTIGTGGSAGSEGPVGYISAGFAASIGRLMRVTGDERRILPMAGFAAGIGAVFHAPMAASLFACEVLYRELDMEHEILVPAIVASTISYAIFGAFHGWDPLWHIPPMAASGYLELVPYLVLAAVVALAGRLFVWIHDQVHHRLGLAARIPLWLRPAVGGLGVGIIGVFVPQAIGVGYGLGQAAILGSLGVGTLLLLALAKMLTSNLTSGSGGSGGLFAPSLVIGATLGGAVALATQQLAPGLDVQTAAFAIVGMAGFFANVINAPMSTVIMVSELTGTYRLLVPTLWVCAIAWFLNRAASLYPEQAADRMHAPGHLADMMGVVLRGIPVHAVMEHGDRAPVSVAPETPLRELVQLFATTTQAVYPIIDPRTGRMTGVVDGRELRRVLIDAGVDQVLIARDLEAKPLTAQRNESIYEAVARMSATGYDEILVVEDDDPGRLVGILSRRAVITAYHRRMLETAPDDPTATAAAAAETAEAPPPPVDLAVALRAGGLIHGLTAVDRTGALRAIVEHLGVESADSRERLMTLLLEREALGSTCIGDGIALPHPQTQDVPGLESPRVVIACLLDALPWGDEPDAPPVSMICMLLAPAGHAHLTLLGQLARALHDPTLRQLLEDQASFEAVLARVDAVQHPPQVG